MLYFQHIEKTGVDIISSHLSLRISSRIFSKSLDFCSASFVVPSERWDLMINQVNAAVALAKWETRRKEMSTSDYQYDEVKLKPSDTHGYH
jgi:hypothetical protein